MNTKVMLYNTLTKKKEAFKPVIKDRAMIYTCGPTVYWFAHVGNFRSYIFSDILHRVLEYNGYELNHIMNVTDVGHLTNDSDDGDDKIEEAAKKEGKGAQEIAQFYFDAFLKDYKKLNLIEPREWIWASKCINYQIQMIQELEKKGYTYKTSDGIYYDTSKFKDYGKLSNKKVEDLKAGSRVSMGEKKHPTDFALWKFSGDEERLQEWDSPWGKGFPGWHIECSAISWSNFGQTFDIHTGGEDHIHIHHENEIAQSEAANGEKLCNYFMHGAFLVLPEGKMSKSKGTIKTVSEFEKDGINPLAFKFFTYSAHYRKQLTWTIEGLKAAQNVFNKLKHFMAFLENDGKKPNEKYKKKFEEAINDDLNMPQAISVLWELIRDKEATGKYQTVKLMDTVFGLDLLTKEEVEIPEEIESLAKERQEARENKDWAKSDELRDLLKEKGWQIKDTKDSYTLEKL